MILSLFWRLKMWIHPDQITQSPEPSHSVERNPQSERTPHVLALEKAKRSLRSAQSKADKSEGLPVLGEGSNRLQGDPCTPDAKRSKIISWHSNQRAGGARRSLLAMCDWRCGTLIISQSVLPVEVERKRFEEIVYGRSSREKQEKKIMENSRVLRIDLM